MEGVHNQKSETDSPQLSDGLASNMARSKKKTKVVEVENGKGSRCAYSRHPGNTRQISRSLHTRYYGILSMFGSRYPGYLVAIGSAIRTTVPSGTVLGTANIWRPQTNKGAVPFLWPPSKKKKDDLRRKTTQQAGLQLHENITPSTHENDGLTRSCMARERRRQGSASASLASLCDTEHTTIPASHSTHRQRESYCAS